MLHALALALALAAPMTPAAAGDSQTFVVNGDGIWWDYEVRSEPLPSGCRVQVIKEKGGTGTAHRQDISIDLARGQTLTMAESAGKVVVRCNKNNTATAEGPR